MAEPKTQKTDASVREFIAAVENDTRRRDAEVLDEMMREVSGEEPAMWGPTIVGYGEYPTGSGSWPRIGFSPRKANLVLYIMDGYEQEPLMAELGKHRTGRSCLYINKLDDVDEAVLREIVSKSWDRMAVAHPD